MSDTATAILDAAERRIRIAGYSGFNTREVAEDVGIKSSSVHYHFATKQQLAAAVARRYTDRFLAAVQSENAQERDPLKAWRDVFRRALVEDGRMCLCGALGAAAADLPAEVNIEVKAFFTRGLRAMTDAGIRASDAMELFARLEGAMLMANVLGGVEVFDQAAASLAV
jgi:TetR/AcrR family transcriptional repressor of nem operon